MKREHLGNLLADHVREHRERVAARLEQERADRARVELERTIVQTWPGEEPDSRWVRWGDGRVTWCAHWSRRPADWPGGRW